MNTKLLQGNCLDLLKDIPDKSVDFILTDPPYGISYCKWDSVIPLERMWVELRRVIKDNGAIALFSSQPFTSALVMSNPKMFKYEWVWDKITKGNFRNAKIQPLRRIEYICMFYSKQPTYNPQGLVESCVDNGRPNHSLQVKGEHAYNPIKRAETLSLHTNYPDNILVFSNKNQGSVHPTQKPVALLEYLIKTYTNAGETVLDFTMGSGSTGVAAVNLNRSFLGIELEEKYYNIAVERIEIAKQSKKEIEQDSIDSNQATQLKPNDQTTLA